MQRRVLYALVTLLVLDLATGFEANILYPTFAPCNDLTIGLIKDLWKIKGTPHDVLQSLHETGDFTVLHTSYDYHNDNNKCVYFKILNGIMNVSFVPRDGGVPANLTYFVTQDPDGVIKSRPVENDAPEFRWNWYSIFYSNGVAAIYFCSDIKGSVQPPLSTIMVANGLADNFLTQTIVSDLNNIVGGWGFDFLFNYGSDCFLTGRKTTAISSVIPAFGIM